MDRIVELAGRVVRTEQGSKLYNKPIGSPILPEEKAPAPARIPGTSATKVTPVTPAKPDDDTDAEVKTKDGAPKEEISMAKIQSLQAQAKAAIRTGDKATIKSTKAAFDAAVAQYSKGRPASEVLSERKKSLTVKKR